MGLCDHLYDAEQQMGQLLSLIHDHLKDESPEHEAYDSLLAVAYHLSQAARELGFLIDEAEETGDAHPKEEVGH